MLDQRKLCGAKFDMFGGGWGGIAGLKRSDSAQRLENGAKSGKMGPGFFPVLGHGRVVIWVSE